MGPEYFDEGNTKIITIIGGAAAFMPRDPTPNFVFDEPYKRNPLLFKAPKKLYIANRNDLCPCGSGLKFKRCCIDKTV